MGGSTVLHIYKSKSTVTVLCISHLTDMGYICRLNCDMLHSLLLQFSYDIHSLFYYTHAVRVVWNNQYPVWTNGESNNFTIQIQLKYPTFTVAYQPNFWQYLKFAWVQYLAVFLVFWWVLSYAQSFVFANQVILTSRKRTEKWHSD